MGIFAEYLDRRLNFIEIAAERKKQLARIAAIRKRDVLVYAADLKKGQAPIGITYPDLLPLLDQLSNLSGAAVDLVLETPGGYAEIAEQIIRIIRDKYKSLAVIVPGTAKSAGTIMTMAADEILLDHSSALGPIDAQLTWQGKVFSADALLKGFERIKAEVIETGQLNKAYIPILQGISPGELESAQNQLDLAKELVTEWLKTHKFGSWAVHSSSGQPVTPEERQARAEEIAGRLCEHSDWRSHGRSIMLSDLEAMGLKITDFSERGAARRCHPALLHPLGNDLRDQHLQGLRDADLPNLPRAALGSGGAGPGSGQSAGRECRQDHHRLDVPELWQELQGSGQHGQAAGSPAWDGSIPEER